MADSAKTTTSKADGASATNNNNNTSSPSNTTTNNTKTAAAASAKGGFPSPVEFEPPLACVRRILKKTLPFSTNVGKDSAAALVRAGGIFIIYLTACANDFARENRRQTITASDVLAAVKELDFDEFSPQLQKFLDNYRASEKSKKEAKAKAAAAAAKAEDDDDEDDEDEVEAESTTQQSPPRKRKRSEDDDSGPEDDHADDDTTSHQGDDGDTGEIEN